MVSTALGPEFSKDVGKTEVIIRVIIGLKSAEAAFRSHLAKCMDSLECESYKVDPDL